MKKHIKAKTKSKPMKASLAKKNIAIKLKKKNEATKIKKEQIIPKIKKKIVTPKSKIVKKPVKNNNKLIVKKKIAPLKINKTKPQKAKIVKGIKVAKVVKVTKAIKEKKVSSPIKAKKVLNNNFKLKKTPQIKKEIKSVVLTPVPVTEPVVKPRAKKVAFFSKNSGTEKGSSSLTQGSTRNVVIADEETVLQPPPATSFMGIPPYEIKEGESYMSESQQAHFDHMLQTWKKNLLKEADKTVNHMKDEVSNLPDLNDRASIEEEVNFELRARDRDRKIIKKIDEALHRIRSDEFGYCELCGVEIGIRRLEARPTATLCIDCKTLAEIKEKQTTG